MDSLFQNKAGEEGEHPPREMLLICVDGELSSKESSQLQAHLEACWRCRVRTKKLEEAIADISEFDEQALKRHINPPNAWRSFDRQLNQLVAESGKRTLYSQALGSWGRIVSTLRLTSTPWLISRVAAGLFAASMVVAMLILSNREATVSASELLGYAMEAQATQIRAKADPVIHQKLQVRRTDQASTREDSVSWEIWNDATRSRFRQSAPDADGRRFTPAATMPGGAAKQSSSFPAVLLDLEQVLRANHMDPRRPLSPASYQAWRDALGQKHDEVTRSRGAGGVEVLSLRTVPAGEVSAGHIAEASLVVRARDWRPVEERLRVKTEQGDLVYELIETAFEVVSLSTLSPDIFSGETASLPPLSTVPKLPAGPRPPAPAMATADLEVEVLGLLSSVRADLGEQVSAKRTGDGLLRVEGIVETDARKAEILRALEPVINQSAIQVEIKTVAEAVAEKRRQGREAPGSATERRVEIQSGSTAAEAELRSHFSSEEQARQFAARMVIRSQQAMRHIYALKRLSSQFPPEELRRLSPEARAKWLALVRSHASAYRQQIAGLRQELLPIFFPTAPEVGEPAGPEIADMAGVIEAIERLFELGSANDRVVLSAFTASSEGATITAIKTGAFWQSLRAAEALAARIAVTGDK